MTCCTLSWPEINSKLTRDVSFLHIININATIITQHYSKIVCLVFQKQRLKSQKGFQKVKSAGFWWKGVQKSSDSWLYSPCVLESGLATSDHVEFVPSKLKSLVKSHSDGNAEFVIFLQRHQERKPWILRTSIFKMHYFLIHFACMFNFRLLNSIGFGHSLNHVEKKNPYANGFMRREETNPSSQTSHLTCHWIGLEGPYKVSQKVLLKKISNSQT